MADWCRTKKEWEFAELVNRNYLPRVRVLHRFNTERQHAWDCCDNVHHVIDFKDGCKIKIMPIDKITDDFEDVEEKLDEVYSKKKCYL